MSFCFPKILNVRKRFAIVFQHCYFENILRNIIMSGKHSNNANKEQINKPKLFDIKELILQNIRYA